MTKKECGGQTYSEPPFLGTWRKEKNSFAPKIAESAFAEQF